MYIVPNFLKPYLWGRLMMFWVTKETELLVIPIDINVGTKYKVTDTELAEATSTINL